MQIAVIRTWMVCGGLALAAAVMPACGSNNGGGAAARPSASAPTSSSAAGSARKVSRDPCALLTKQEVEAVLQTTVGKPVSRGNVCHFVPEGQPVRGISLSVAWTGGEAAMQRAKAGERLIGSLGDKDVQAAMQKMSGSGADLDGLGDEASFRLVTLHVRKGDAYLTFDTRLCSRAHAIDLARKAVARL